MYRCKAFIGVISVFVICLNLFAFGGDANNSSKGVDENLMILQGLYGEQKNPTNSSKIFEDLYDSTKNPEYIKEAIKIAFVYRSENLIDLMEKASEILKDDLDFMRIKAAYLLEYGRFNEALEVAQKLVKDKPTARNYAVLGIVEGVLNLNKEALENFKKSYSLEQSDENLLRVVDVLLNKLGNSKEAIRELETYRKIKGCTIGVCSVLADIYKRDQNYRMLVNIYEELYKTTQNTTYLDRIVNFYTTHNDFNKTIEILEKYDYNGKLLIEIYGYNKEFEKALKKAAELYEKSGDVEFLAMEAMFLYETSMSNLSETTLKDIIAKFENSVPNLDIALLQNYYGYLLIDHDIDIQKGISLVQKALEKEPSSPYYLDSLAWGYYKLKECKEADRVMNIIDKNERDFFDSKEAKGHLKAIKECINPSKKDGSKK